MKKLLSLIILSIAMVSCYDNYITDFTYTSISFPYQMDVRTFVVGEGMKIDVGASLGGVRDNTFDRNVSFILDNTLITPELLAKMKAASQAYIKNAVTPVTTLLPLPANYYSISNPNTIVIKSGQHMGAVTIQPDSVAFLNDSLNTMFATYILPFYITAADADSILYLKRRNAVGLRFENMLFGSYWHGGAAVVNRPGKADTTIIYKTTIPVVESKIWSLTTKGPNTLFVNGYLDQTTTKNELKLVLHGNNVYVSTATATTGLPATAPSFTYSPDGASTFNRAKLLQDRKIFLKYSFVNGVNTYHCTDTLTFRNRLRDGVNEWQDENPSHYTK
jgi:hypothetical protein